MDGIAHHGEVAEAHSELGTGGGERALEHAKATPAAQAVDLAAHPHDHVQRESLRDRRTAKVRNARSANWIFGLSTGAFCALSLGGEPEQKLRSTPFHTI